MNDTYKFGPFKMLVVQDSIIIIAIYTAPIDYSYSIKKNIEKLVTKISV